MTDEELIETLDKLMAMMIAVATNGPQIQTVERQFVALFDEAESELRSRGYEKFPPYRSLWDWYGRWSQDDLPTYKSRRKFVSDAFEVVRKQLRETPAQPYEPTGWVRVDRTVTEMRRRLDAAENEEQFQSVGLLGRELLISAAQEVFDPDR